jgi:hypothetical protein
MMPRNHRFRKLGCTSIFARRKSENLEHVIEDLWNADQTKLMSDKTRNCGDIECAS